MKIDLVELREDLRGYMERIGVDKYTVMASYGGEDRLKSIVIIPRVGDEAITDEDAGL